MAAVRSKRSAAPGEPNVVETPRKPTKPRTAAKPKPAAARKRTAAEKPVPRAVLEPAPMPAAPTPAARKRRTRAPLLLFLVLVSFAAAGAMLLVTQWDRSVEQPTDALAAFADAQEGPVYWAGPIDARQLELTRTADGTFVRYLPAGVEAGDPGRALTVATYPMQNAYATATLRARSRATISRQISGGGIAVWSKAEPTSVYVAYPRVPHLVEVYAPNAAEARRLALSGRIAPVR